MTTKKVSGKRKQRPDKFLLVIEALSACFGQEGIPTENANGSSHYWGLPCGVAVTVKELKDRRVDLYFKLVLDRPLDFLTNAPSGGEVRKWLEAIAINGRGRNFIFTCGEKKVRLKPRLAQKFLNILLEQAEQAERAIAD